jgi:hypothetical protein
VLTVSQAQTLLSPYVGAGLNFLSRLNLARERLLKAGNWSGTKQQVIFNAFPDANGRGFITLPFNMGTVLAMAPLPPTDGQCVGYSMRTRGPWYEFSASGAGYTDNQKIQWARGVVPINATFTTFADWTGGMLLRIVPEQSESGTIIFRGLDAYGNPIWSTINGVWQEGYPLTFSGSSTVTTAQMMWGPPYAIIKPVTNGRLSFYAVDGSGNATLVGIYQPEEQAIAWRRYKVPVCSKWTSSAPGQYVAIVKLGYYPLADQNDPVFPSNIGALRWGLQALTEEDNQDERATKSWAKALKILADEVEDDTGYGSEGVLQRTDDFAIGAMYGGI